jgi:RNA polymerase sigma factor (TIGR02999 family)
MGDGDITARLIEARSGDAGAVDRLFAAVYSQLKALARRELRLGGRTPTLGATALVHEAYMRLVDQTQANWNDRGHFFAVAAKAMRQITIDHARRKRAAKRGAGGPAVELEESHAVSSTEVDDVIAVDVALTRLAAASPRLVQVVELCFFAGLTVEEAAEALATSPATVKRDWRKAKALLQAWIRGEPPAGPIA